MVYFVQCVLKVLSGFNYKAAIVSLVKTATNELSPCAQSGAGGAATNAN